MQQDKLKHVIAGFATFWLFHFAGVYYAASAVVLVAFAKEFTDWYTGKGDPDLFDALATIAGGILAMGWLIVD